MKALAARITGMSQAEIAQFEMDGQFAIDLDGQQAVVDLADVEIISEDIPGWLVANEGNLTVALEVALSDELKNEGMARELINRIQNIRKESGLEITDRIVVTLPLTENFKALSHVFYFFCSYFALVR